MTEQKNKFLFISWSGTTMDVHNEEGCVNYGTPESIYKWLKDEGYTQDKNELTIWRLHEE